MFSGITVPLDGSPVAESALPYALALGDALHIPITLMHVVPLTRLTLDYQLRYDAAEEATSLARASAALELRARSLASPSRRIEVYAAVGDPAEEIVRYAELRRDRCIVIATHGWGGALHWTFGSIARKVLTTATVPTLIVRPRAAPERPDEPAMLQNILVPLDGSDSARKALTLATTIAKPLGAAVTLARVVPIPTGMYLDAQYAPMVAQSYLTEARAAERAAAVADLDATADALKQSGIPATAVVESGSPAHQILDLLAGGQYDLVVMSSHGRTGITRWVLGSVAERLVEASHTPVLIVREKSPPTVQE